MQLLPAVNAIDDFRNTEDQNEQGAKAKQKMQTSV